jgi:isochorismate hydrolase
MLATKIREWRYSVSDVIFEDVQNVSVPSEYQTLYDEYCAEIDILPVETPMWRSATPEYKNVLLEKSRHKAYTRSLLCSGDPKAIRAAEEAMLNQLGRYYESYQQEKLFRQCRTDLEKLRKDNPRWVAQK